MPVALKKELIVILKFDQANPDFPKPSETAIYTASQQKVPKVAIRRLTLTWPFRAKCVEANAPTSRFQGGAAVNESSFVT